MRKLLLPVLFLLAACTSQQQVASWNTSGIKLNNDSLQLHDIATEQMIAPYKAKLDSQMNRVLIKLDADIKKDQPEGALGNFLCDALLDYAKQKEAAVSFCIFNNGGIRVPVWYAGDISVRNVYELMPFDNSVVLLRLKGSKCLELFNAIAQANGIPVSGVRMNINAALHAENILINNAPLDTANTYWMVCSDYLAGGNDGATALLNPLERINTGMLVRDVLMQHLEAKGKRGEILSVKTDGRISKK